MDKEECFVIMPISDVEGYDSKHFNLVYEDIIKKACIDANYKPIRADDVKQTNMIHKDILQRILDSPMAICDLSANNPNVLFELGIRQAFDKPTVLIKDDITKSIFDISPLRHTEYSSSHNYRSVLESQKIIKDAIMSTAKSSADKNSINSLIRLLSLPKAASLNTEIGDEKDSFNFLLLQQINDIQNEMKNLTNKFIDNVNNINEKEEIWSLITQLKKFINEGYPKQIIKQNYFDINRRLNEFDDYLSKVEKSKINNELIEIKNYINSEV